MNKTSDLATYLFLSGKEIEESITLLDEKLGKVFYPSSKSIKDGLEKSMA